MNRIASTTCTTPFDDNGDSCTSHHQWRGVRKTLTSQEHHDGHCEDSDTSSIPADGAYIAAVGRAFHHFTYLEWVLVSITEKLNQEGYASSTQGMTSGYLARKLLEILGSGSSRLAPSLRQSLVEFHRGFVTAKHRRDKLVNSHPFITGKEVSRICTGQHAWPTEKLDAAAAQFEKTAIQGSAILQSLLQSSELCAKR